MFLLNILGDNLKYDKYHRQGLSAYFEMLFKS